MSTDYNSVGRDANTKQRIREEIRGLTDERLPVPIDWYQSDTQMSFDAVLGVFDTWDDALEYADLLDRSEVSIGTWELMDIIRTRQERTGKVPTMYSICEWINVHPDEFMVRFDSWSQVLDAATPDGQTPECHKIPTDELLCDIQRVSQKVDGDLSRSQLQEHGAYSLGPYRDRFGSVSEALKEAGCYESPYVSKEDLIEDIHKVAEKIDDVPNTMDMNRHGEYDHQTFYGKDGWDNWWEDIIPAAGLDGSGRERDPEREQMIDDLRRIDGQVKGRPTMDDISELGDYTYHQYYLKFGGLQEACNAAGV